MIVIYEEEIPQITIIEDVDYDTLPDLAYSFNTVDWEDQSSFPTNDGEFINSIRT